MSTVVNPETVLAAPAETRPAAPRRATLAAPIHKAMRSFIMETLGRIGRLDVGDAAEVDAAMQQLQTLVAFCERHTHHEETVIHPMLEARQPGVTTAASRHHVRDGLQLESLRSLSQRLAAASPGERQALADALYQQLALFAADDFQHMEAEESQFGEALWSYGESALAALPARIMASESAPNKALLLHWMVRALSRGELDGFLSRIRAHASPEALRGIFGPVKPLLDEATWARVARSVGQVAW